MYVRTRHVFLHSNLHHIAKIIITILTKKSRRKWLIIIRGTWKLVKIEVITVQLGRRIFSLQQFCSGPHWVRKSCFVHKIASYPSFKPFCFLILMRYIFFSNSHIKAGSFIMFQSSLRFDGEKKFIQLKKEQNHSWIF